MSYLDANDFAIKVEDVFDEALNRLGSSEFQKFLRYVKELIGHYED